MQNNQQASEKQVTAIDEYHKMEIQEIFTSIRTANTLRIQVYSFFGTANLTILGVALSAKHAGLILLAASIIGVLLLVDRQLRRYSYVFLSRGVQLEELYAPDKVSAFIHKYVAESSYAKANPTQRYWLALFVLMIEIVMAILSRYSLDWSWL